jgi:hypothetical protein
MAAEFLALATIRPVLSLAVDVIGPRGLGLIGGNGAAQLGFPVGAGGPAGAGSSGAGGIGLPNVNGLFGGGGSSWLGSFGTWLNTPFTGGMAGVANLPSGVMGPAPNTAVGGLSGMGGASAFTPLGTAASLGGIGMGIYSLASGGGSTSSIISGASGIIGGGLGLAAMAFPALAGTLGPIGIGVGLLGAILPSLLGGGGPKIPPAPAFQYSGGSFIGTASGGFRSIGDNALGGGVDLISEATSISQQVSKMFRSAGLTTVPGQLIGGHVSAGQDARWDGRSWQPHPFTNAGLKLPGGSTEYFTNQDTSRDLQAASDYVAAQVFRANVLRGGVTGAGPGLRAGVERINPQTTEALQSVIALGTAYDRLGKAANPAKDALDKISASFDDLKSFATQAGLSLDPINAELAKQSKRSAQDFIDAMLDPLAVQMRALDDERSAALESARYIRDNITGVYVDLDRITDFYGKKRLALEDQFYGGAITNLQALIDRATYGDLANATPTLQLSGARSAYQEAYRQARAGDATAIGNLSGYAETYLSAGQSYFASGPEYEALKAEIVAALREVQVSLGVGGSSSGGSSAATGTNDAMLAQLNNENSDLREALTESNRQSQKLMQRVQDLIDIQQRVAANT